MNTKARRSYSIGDRVRFSASNVCGTVVKIAPHTPWVWVDWDRVSGVKLPHLLHVAQVMPV